jgi:hypothetical protein
LEGDVRDNPKLARMVEQENKKIKYDEEARARISTPEVSTPSTSKGVTEEHSEKDLHSVQETFDKTISILSQQLAFMSQRLVECYSLEEKILCLDAIKKCTETIEMCSRVSKGTH